MLKVYKGAVYTSSRFISHKRVTYLEKEKPPLFSCDQQRLSLRYTSVSGGIHLLRHFGAGTVVCVGLDGKTAPDGRRHAHDDAYPWPLKANAFERQRGELELLAPIYAKAGLRVLNANPDSAFRMFEFCDLDEVLDEVRKSMGRDNGPAGQSTG